MTDLVPVGVPCPSGQHPDGDSVSLKPKLGLAGGIAARRTIGELTDGSTEDDVIGVLMEVYLRHGVVEWTLHDDANQPLELNPKTLRAHLLDDIDLAIPIANKADELYSPEVVTPLVKRVAALSQALRAESSTSPQTEPKSSRRKRSKRSSTSTTPTDGTAPTSA